MRATNAIAAGASALLLILGVSGCANDDTASSNSGVGPNGYTQAGVIDGTEVEVWYDYAESTNEADVVLMLGNDVVGVCLGGEGTMCIEGDKYDTPYGIFITSPAAERAELNWGGAPPAPMNLAADGIEPDRAVVWVIAPPPIPAGGLATPSMAAFNAAGEVIAFANS